MYFPRGVKPGIRNDSHSFYMKENNYSIHVGCIEI